MIFGMTAMDQTSESEANVLCKSCGLCCTGHLFIWTKLRSTELDSVDALGVKVFRSVPSQRGFNQPCPLWQGECTIYTSSHYPHFCHIYKCKLLKSVLDEHTSLPDALAIVQQAKRMIEELERLLPTSKEPTFRERFVAHLEALGALDSSSKEEESDGEFRRKAHELLACYEQVFGVKDLVDPLST
jgi:uncharacterized protein